MRRCIPRQQTPTFNNRLDTGGHPFLGFFTFDIGVMLGDEYAQHGAVVRTEVCLPFGDVDNLFFCCLRDDFLVGTREIRAVDETLGKFRNAIAEMGNHLQRMIDKIDRIFRLVRI